jgi:hypothetical protein
MPNAGLWTDTVFYVAAAAFLVALAAAAYIWGQRRASIEAQQASPPERPHDKNKNPAIPGTVAGNASDPPKTAAMIKTPAEAPQARPVPLAKTPAAPAPGQKSSARAAVPDHSAEPPAHLPSFSWGGLLEKMERFESEIASIKSLVSEKSVSGQDVAKILEKLQSQLQPSQPSEEIQAIASRLERFEGEFSSLRGLFEAAAKDNAALREMVSKLKEETVAQTAPQAVQPTPDAGRAVAFIQSLLEKMEHFETEISSVKSLLSSTPGPRNAQHRGGSAPDAPSSRSAESSPKLVETSETPRETSKPPRGSAASSAEGLDSGGPATQRKPVWPV